MKKKNKCQNAKCDVFEQSAPIPAIFVSRFPVTTSNTHYLFIDGRQTQCDCDKKWAPFPALLPAGRAYSLLVSKDCETLWKHNREGPAHFAKGRWVCKSLYFWGGKPEVNSSAHSPQRQPSQKGSLWYQALLSGMAVEGDLYAYLISCLTFGNGLHLYCTFQPIEHSKRFTH